MPASTDNSTWGERAHEIVVLPEDSAKDFLVAICWEGRGGALVLSNKTCAREAWYPSQPWPRSLAASRYRQGIPIRQLWYGASRHTVEEIDNCRVHLRHASLPVTRPCPPPACIQCVQRSRETRRQTNRRAARPGPSALSNTQSNTHAMPLDRGRRPQRRPCRVEPGITQPPHDALGRDWLPFSKRRAPPSSPPDELQPPLFDPSGWT